MDVAGCRCDGQITDLALAKLLLPDNTPNHDVTGRGQRHGATAGGIQGATGFILVVVIQHQGVHKNGNTTAVTAGRHCYITIGRHQPINDHLGLGLNGDRRSGVQSFDRRMQLNPTFRLNCDRTGCLVWYQRQSNITKPGSVDCQSTVFTLPHTQVGR